MRLPVAVALVLMASSTMGCSEKMQSVSIIDGRVQEGELYVSLGICKGEDKVAEVTERDDSVTVRVQARRRSSGDQLACSDGLRVPLEAPLGDRRLIDAATKKQVEVRVVPGS